MRAQSSGSTTRTTSGSGPAARRARVPAPGPQHDDAVDGFVVAVDRGPLHLRAPDGRRRPTVRSPPCGPGSWAASRWSSATGSALVGDTSGDAGALARIVRIAERTSVLRRTADDDDTTAEGRQERVVVANADQLVIVSALADPPPRTGFINTN